MFETIKRLIDETAQLATPARKIAPGADLRRLGLTPYTAIRLMLVVERSFGVEFPRHMLNTRTMASMNAIATAVQSLQQRGYALQRAA
jgi:acyl carrier protein